MSGILTAFIGRVAGVVTDAYFNLVTLLLSGDGTNGAQNNTFLDSSSNNFTITRNGNTTQGTFSPFSQTGWSNFNPDSDNGIGVAANSALDMGTGDFTIEAWVNTAKLPTTNAFQTSSGGYQSVFATGPNLSASGSQLYIGVTNLKFDISTDGGGPIDVAHNMVAGQWYHIAITRSGTTFRAFINGSLVQTVTSISTSWVDGYGLGIMRAEPIGGYGGAWWYGYASNFRLTKGGALYTANFTPSTAPLTTTVSAGTVSLLTCQSNRFIDNSSNAFAVTVNGTPFVQAFSPFAPTAAYSAATVGGSGYFDGTGDYLSVADNAAFDFGSGDFTIECWTYMTSAAQQFFISQWNSPQRSWAFLVKNSGTTLSFVYSTTGSNEVAIDGTIAAQANRWAHFAAVRNGNTLKTYMNGVEIGSASVTGVTFFNASQAIEVGRNPEATSTWNLTGYAASMRVVKGTAVYTAAFTPPTAPPTAITNTSLLLNYTNAGITDATAKNDLETVGNAQISTTQSKFGGSSMYFDGSGDRIYEPSNQNYNFGSGDFTIEFWVNPISQGGHGSSNNDCLIDFRDASGTSVVRGTLYIYSNGTGVYWYVNGANRITGGAISNSTWTHIALCRSGTSTKLFINGTQSGSTYTDTNVYLVSPIMIGEFNDGTGGGNFYGYIDELRISKYARYTANFTAPTAAFPLQ